MRAGQELGLRLRTSSIMKACPKIKEKLPKLKLRRKTTPQQEEGERLSHDCSPGTWRSSMAKPKPRPSQNPPGWNRHWSSGLGLAAEMPWMLLNQPQFPSCSLVCCCNVYSSANPDLEVEKQEQERKLQPLCCKEALVGQGQFSAFLREPRKTKTTTKKRQVCMHLAVQSAENCFTSDEITQFTRKTDIR